MKRSLAHLPRYKKNELKLIKKTILGLTKVEMIILYGSHCGDKWVENECYIEDSKKYSYSSDFDILVVTKSVAKLHNLGLWEKVSRHIRNNADIKTRVGMITQDIHQLNKYIDAGEFFFSDIKREGIFLHNTKNFRLARQRKLDPIERQKKAQSEFNYWYHGAKTFLASAMANFEKGELLISTFELHQATERFLCTVLLVFTNYKEKSHDVEELSRQVINLNPAFVSVFPHETEEEQQCFQLLKHAYIDARYKMEFSISPSQFIWLSERVHKLERLTEEICLPKIASFHSPE